MSMPNVLITGECRSKSRSPSRLTNAKGGTGFIASHCIELLLQRGYNVVTTVRSKEKGDKVLGAFSKISTGKLSYTVVKDVASEGSFSETVKNIPGFDFVIHTTSPFIYSPKDPIKDMLEPSIQGTTNIFSAIKAFAPSVKRVVLLSSIASARNPDKEPIAYDESHWNPVTWDQAVADSSKTYQGSKALAERAAWEFMEREKPNFDLVTILPVLVVGPVALHLGAGDADSVNTSNLRVLDMVQGKMKDRLTKSSFYKWVDVRDVAVAHVNALEVPEAGGQRFLIDAGYFENKDVAQIVAGMGSEYAQNLPSNINDLPSDIPAPKDRYTVDNSKSISILGIKYRPFEACIRDTVSSFKRIMS